MSNNSFNIGNNWNKDDLVKEEASGMVVLLILVKYKRLLMNILSLK